MSSFAEQNVATLDFMVLICQLMVDPLVASYKEILSLAIIRGAAVDRRVRLLLDLDSLVEGPMFRNQTQILI